MMIEPKLRFKADDGSDFPDWEEKTLGEICEQLKASIDPRNNPTKQFIEYSMPAYDNHMTAQAVLGQSMNSARKILSAPCVLINKLNVRKRRIWVVEHPEDNAVCSSEFVPLTSAEFDLTFLGYLAMTDSFTGYLLDCSSGSSNSQKRVTPDTILQYLVSLPSLPEQRKIAGLLSTVDDVIAAQEAEVAAWEKRKKGVMQKLFSQEVRFKADDGSDFPDWEEKALGDLGTFLKGAPLSKSDITDEGTPLILYGELYTTYAEVAYSIARRTDKKVPDKFYSKVGDVVIPTSGETPEEISTATCVMKDGVILAGDLYIYRPATNVDGRILSYLLNHQVNNAISRIAQGKSVVHVQSKELERIHVIFPSSPIEQRKIADCLASLDDVIAKAKGELDAWRELKKGLLQQMFV